MCTLSEVNIMDYNTWSKYNSKNQVKYLYYCKKYIKDNKEYVNLLLNRNDPYKQAIIVLESKLNTINKKYINKKNLKDKDKLIDLLLFYKENGIDPLELYKTTCDKYK